MNKHEILKHYTKEEDRLLIAKVLDKLEFSQTRNKITNTDFLDGYQKKLIQQVLTKLKISNFLFYGGFEEAERTIVIFYPDKFADGGIQKNYNNILNVIEIILPNELQGTYQHRDYLGGLMKLGMKREKIGDIVTFTKGTHIVVIKEIAEYIVTSLQELTRFSKAKIQIKEIEEIQQVEIQKEEIHIIVSSLRADNIISELAKTSRTKAKEWIAQGRIFINFESVEKDAKVVKEQDKITIRGKGRFELVEVVGNTKKGRYVVKVDKYI